MREDSIRDIQSLRGQFLKSPGEFFGQTGGGGLPAQAPHRVVHGVINGILDIPASISDSISRPLDSAPLGNDGPHRSVDDLAKAVSHSLEKLSDGITLAADKPVGATGVR